MKNNLYISTIDQITGLQNRNSSDWMSKSEIEMSDLVFHTPSIEKRDRKWGNKLQYQLKQLGKIDAVLKYEYVLVSYLFILSVTIWNLRKKITNK